MLLAVDIGNTNIVFGIINGKDIKEIFRTETYGDFTYLLNNIKIKYNIEGIVISSVVPSVNEQIESECKKLFKCKVIIIDSLKKSGLTICTDCPEKTGADLICGAAAAFDIIKSSVIVFDLGTAATVCAVDKCGNYLGHSIYPGINLSYKALNQYTAQLPLVDSTIRCNEIIGKNTVSSIQSGVILGAACFIDGMTERYCKQMGEKAEIFITGGLSELVIPHCKVDLHYRPYLVLEGMQVIYQKNQ